MKPPPRRPWQPLLRSIDLIDLDVDAMVAAAAANGVDSLIVNAGGFMAFYDTTLPHQRRNPHMTRDFVGEVVSAAAPRGLQIFGRLDFSKGFPDLAEAHPDWFVVGPDGRPVVYWEMVQTCFTGSYVQEHSLAVVDELLSLHPLDGLFVNFHYLPPCYCERCEAEVQRRTGSPVPRGERPEPAYERWRHRRLAAHTARLRERMRGHRPEARLMVYHHLHKGWDPRLMADAVDLWTAQISSPLVVNPADPQPTWPHWPGEEARKGRALKPDAPPLLVLSYSALFASRRALQPGDRLASHMMQAAAHGGSPCLALSGVPSRQEDERPLDTVAARYRQLRLLHAFFDEPVRPKPVALIYSPDSLWFGPDGGRPQGVGYGHVAEFRGLYAALTDLRYGFDVQVAGRLDAEVLPARRVVVLPAVACLGDRDAALLLDWVREGGWLICTGDTGRADEDGAKRDASESLLFPELGLHRASVDGAYLEVRSGSLRAALGGTALMGLAGPFWRLPQIPRDADLRLLGPHGNNNPEFAFLDDQTPATGPVGLSRTREGRGGVAWLPWLPGALYHHFALPEIPLLLGHELGTCLGPASVQSDAPPGVEIVLHELEHPPGTGRRLLFLINDTAAAERPRLATIPLGPIEVSLDRPISRAVSGLSGRELPLERVAGRTRVRLERLDGAEVLILDP